MTGALQYYGNIKFYMMMSEHKRFHSDTKKYENQIDVFYYIY